MKEKTEKLCSDTNPFSKSLQNNYLLKLLHTVYQIIVNNMFPERDVAQICSTAA